MRGIILMKKFNKSAAVFLVFCMLLTLLPKVVFAPQQGDVEQLFYTNETLSNCIIPILEEELKYLSEMQDGGIQAFSAEPFPYPYTKIRDSGLSYDDSIVIILFGDGFAEDAYGSWPNPAPGTALRHFDNAINSMINTHPFGLFEDLFTVYVIHTPEINPVTGNRGYFGTIFGLELGLQNEGAFVNLGWFPQFAGKIRTFRSRQLADALVPRHQQAMIQILSNSRGGGGYAWFGGIAVTTIQNDSVPVGGSNFFWPDGTSFHAAFIHEFGHSFGFLADEYSNSHLNELRANATRALDADVKWRHWGGHRNVSVTPNRLSDGWAVPTILYTTNRCCIMSLAGVNHNFCGVCTAELIRRLALRRIFQQNMEYKCKK
jgi:hypothetical protein